MSHPMEDIPTVLFALMGRVDEHVHAANALSGAQANGGAKDVERARARLLASLNDLAETNVAARKQMMVLSQLQGAVAQSRVSLK